MKQEVQNAKQTAAAHPEASECTELEFTSDGALARMIYTTLGRQGYQVPQGHQIRFAAQDDCYAAKWQALPKVTMNTGRRTQVKNALSAQIYLEVRAECQAWLDAVPGPMNVASNVMASSHVKRFLRCEEVTDEEISRLHNWMSYRLDLMSLATSVKTMIGLNYRDCIGFDCQAWREHACSQRSELHKLYVRHVLHSGIFPRPTAIQGRKDQKPEKYLASAFVDCGWKKGHVQAALELMVARSAQHVDGIVQTLRGNDKIRQELERASHSTGDRTKASQFTPTLNHRGNRRSIPAFDSLRLRLRSIRST